MTTKPLARRGAVAALFVFGLAANAPASAQEPTPLERACVAANLVVIAEVTSVEASLQPGGGGRIRSSVDLVVQGVAHGPSVATVHLNVDGGSVGDLTLELSGTPLFEEGHRWLLGLNQGPGRPLRLVNGVSLRLDPEVSLPPNSQLSTMWEQVCNAQ